MQPRSARLLLVCLLLVVTTVQLPAQVSAPALTGTITDASGHPVASAKISIKSITSGHTSEYQASPSGTFEVPTLSPGDYEVSVSASGFETKVERLTALPEGGQRLNLSLATSGLSVESLGFPSTTTQGNAHQQALLDKRSHMLKVHQRLGLITTVPLAATLLTGSLAGGRETSSTGRNVHAALGATTAGLYFTTAYFSIFAPKVPGTETKGPIKLHKFLAFVHGPGMILTPILGAMAYEQKSNGERVHGIASAHSAVAATTAIAYGAAILSVSIKWHRRSLRADTPDQP